MAYGASGANGYVGSVRVKIFNGTSWSQLGSDLTGNAPDDNAGRAVALSSDGLTVSIDIAYV